MFFVFKKNQVLLFTALVIIIAGALAFSAFSDDEDVALCRSFLESLGYAPEGAPFEVTRVSVPEGFGPVYENYSALNREAGFDLTPLRGRTVTKMSFRLSGEDALYANILIDNKRICGGDICDPALSGFMRPLSKRSENAA